MTQAAVLVNTHVPDRRTRLRKRSRCAVPKAAPTTASGPAQLRAMVQKNAAERVTPDRSTIQAMARLTGLIEPCCT
jgi:hypothetical protein